MRDQCRYHCSGTVVTRVITFTRNFVQTLTFQNRRYKIEMFTCPRREPSAEESDIARYQSCNAYIPNENEKNASFTETTISKTVAVMSDGGEDIEHLGSPEASEG